MGYAPHALSAPALTAFPRLLYRGDPRHRDPTAQLSDLFVHPTPRESPSEWPQRSSQSGGQGRARQARESPSQLRSPSPDRLFARVTWSESFLPVSFVQHLVDQMRSRHDCPGPINAELPVGPF